jgi:hypothetical protein
MCKLFFKIVKKFLFPNEARVAEACGEKDVRLWHRQLLKIKKSAFKAPGLNGVVYYVDFGSRHHN